MKAPVQTQAKMKPALLTAPTSALSGLLQCKRACGDVPGVPRECIECHSRPLQWSPMGQTVQASISSWARDVPTTPSQQPASTTSEQDIPSFMHNFSSVPIHSSNRAKRFFLRQGSRSVPTANATTADDLDFLRAHACYLHPNPANPLRHEFTDQERRLAIFGLGRARYIVPRALIVLGHRDSYHLRMAERTFGSPLTFETLERNTRRIMNALNNLRIGQNVFAATCDDEYCNTGRRNYVAYALDDLSGVVLCPFFFTLPPLGLAITFMHEAGHLARIDVHWAPGTERYCTDDCVIDFTNICPLVGENLLENVDAWARFLYVLSVSG